MQNNNNILNFNIYTFIESKYQYLFFDLSITKV